MPERRRNGTAPDAAREDAVCAAAAFDHGELATALAALGEAAGLGRLPPAVAESRVPPARDGPAVADFLARAGDAMNLELEEVSASGEPAALRRALRHVGPGLVELPGERRRWLAVVDAGARAARVVDRDLRVRHVSLAALVRALSRPAVDAAAADVSSIVEAAGLAGRAARRARRALVVERVRRAVIGGLWLARVRPARRFAGQLGHARVHWRIALLVLVHLAASVLWLASWWFIGRIAMGGIAEPGWMAAWLLCVALLIPARAVVGWQQNVLAVDLGALLRRRLLAGALAMDADRIKRDGLGRLLGIVLECDVLGAMGTTGAILIGLAVVELLPAPWALAAGAAGWLHVLLLAAWSIPIAVVLWRQISLRAQWSDRRLELTHELVEGMLGHRTRLAQLPPERWHVAEDRAVSDYVGASERYDRSRVAVLHLLARGWLVCAVALLVPAVAAGAEPTAIAISIGAAIYCYAAFDRLSSGIERAASALDAWRRVAPLFEAAAGADRPSPVPVSVPSRAATAPGAPLLEASQVSYCYAGRGQSALRDVDLRIATGERVLIEGPSGSGKSTLASILAAQRRPQTGLLLLDHLDLDTVGVGRWRRRVALVPQFHDNHVVAETFLFNILMARQWPPSDVDVAEAERVCAALGLDQLLAAMPAGMSQVVGDTGWNLSHGERSRLFVARALLQDPDVLILDESLAALDPELLDQVSQAVLARSRTLVVIAHP